MGQDKGGNLGGKGKRKRHDKVRPHNNDCIARTHMHISLAPHTDC